LVVVGASHRSASVAFRERIYVDETEYGDFFARLRDAGIAEALVLSTCDRVEVHLVHAEPEAAAAAIRGVFAAHGAIDPAEAATTTYMIEGKAAVRHLFAIAASLDSLTVGEPQVLGQVKESHRVAQSAGLMGGMLDRLLQAAYASAKRVRSETSIGAHPVSIAASAVRVARGVHGDLAGRNGLLLGVGELGELVAQQLRAAGLGRLVVAHRSQRRAEAPARRLGANFAPLDSLGELLPAADIVVSNVGLGGYTLTRELLAEALRRRRQRPVFVADLAVPPDAEPAAAGLDGVFLYDTADLENVARAGLAERESAAEEAWRLVDEAVADYMRGQSMRAAAPAIVTLREHFEAVRAEVLAEAGGDVEEATRLLVNRLLHAPSEALREIAAEGDQESGEALVRRLFGLADGETGPGEGGDT
jgi:glutamyl-tRNA reductase